MANTDSWRGTARVRPAHILAAVLLAALVPASARAQERPITWSIHQSGAVTQGTEFLVKVHADIPPTWHLYSLTQPPGGPLPTNISVPAGQPFVLARTIVGPDPDVAPDKNFDILTESYSDSVTFPVHVLPRDAGSAKLLVEVFFMTCNDHICLPPRTDTLTIALKVSPGEAVTAAALAAAPPATPPETISPTPEAAPAAAPVANGVGGLTVPGGVTNPDGTTTTSLPIFLGFAALMGALSLLTPCVFPMVPITVSYFTQRGAASRGAAAKQAMIYAGGIMATFTVLGMAIALLVGAGGINRFAANPWVNLLITGIFAAFALNLFGVFQLQLPSELLTRLDGASREGGGTAGLLLMGLTFTLTSFTCTTPLVGTLLVMASQGSWAWPVLGLLVFSGVFALPFFLLALLPSAVQRLPKSGAWLGLVKPVLGCIELAMAFKFLSNADLIFGWGIFMRDLVLVAWLLLAVAVVVLVFDLIPRLRGRKVAGLSLGRGLVGLAAAAVVVLLGRGLTGVRLGELESFLPPREGRVVTGSTSVPGELPWIVNDYPAALALAKSEGKAVLIDFTGYTCTNCRWMEANMFPRAEVVAELEQFVRVRLYTDGRGEPYIGQQAMEQSTFNTVALPLYAIMDNDGTARKSFLGMTRDPKEFVGFLSEGRSLALGKSSAP